MTIGVVENQACQEYGRMLWSCRRGRLELDLWFKPLKDMWHDLSRDEKDKVWLLLQSSDESLWVIFEQHPILKNLVVAI